MTFAGERDFPAHVPALAPFHRRIRGWGRAILERPAPCHPALGEGRGGGFSLRPSPANDGPPPRNHAACHHHPHKSHTCHPTVSEHLSPGLCSALVRRPVVTLPAICVATGAP